MWCWFPLQGSGLFDLRSSGKERYRYRYRYRWLSLDLQQRHGHSCALLSAFWIVFDSLRNRQ